MVWGLNSGFRVWDVLRAFGSGFRIEGGCGVYIINRC